MLYGVFSYLLVTLYVCKLRTVSISTSLSNGRSILIRRANLYLTDGVYYLIRRANALISLTLITLNLITSGRLSHSPKNKAKRKFQLSTTMIEHHRTSHHRKAKGGLV
jgi:hypothetical protein